MNHRSRREFLSDVGSGMLVASLGSAVALELGVPLCAAEEVDQRITFGKLEPLVSLMQETPPDKLLPLLVDKLKAGAELKTLVVSAALANGRAFGGQDYEGYHTFMALAPAYQMARELPADRRALPVLKVLYRNSSRIQKTGASQRDAMQPIEPPAESTTGDGNQGGERLRQAVRQVDWRGAEARLAAAANRSAGEAFHQLQFAVQDEVDVHRVVLAWRAWAMLDLSGPQYAQSLLRQSVRYCLNIEQSLRDQDRPRSSVREVLPRLLDQYRLLSKPLGDRQAEDAWIDALARTIARGAREQAADAAAGALAEGMHPQAVAEAIAVAANLLLLHDPGRREQYSSPRKPTGCVHGDSVGVHASDAANAWRNIAQVADSRNQIASLIVGAFHTAGQAQWITKDPFPYAPLLERIEAKDAAALLQQAEEAIKSNDQARACAVVHRYGQLQLPPRPVFDLLLKYAVSEDGALHAEKYYRTVAEEFARTRPAFRWRQLIALARVTASEYGFPAPGVRESRQLLGISQAS